MRGQEFRARDKKVQKMTRDGLTEKNLAAGTEERISGRLADVSFGREKTEDTAAGRRAQIRIRKTMRGSGVPARDTGKEAEGRNQPGAERRRIAKKGNAGEKRQDRKVPPPGEAARPDMAEDERTPSMHGIQEEKTEGGVSGREKMEDTGIDQDETAVPGLPETGHIWGTDRAEVEDISEIRPDRKKRMGARCPGGGRKPGKAVRLRYEKSEIPPEERAGERAAEDVNPAGEKEAAKPRRMKQYEKAQRRVERAEGKLKKAQENLPARTHVRLQKEYDGESGKVRRRLHFETEVIPENEKPVLVKRAGRAAGSAVYTAAVLKAHQKIREAEADNVGVEASHKAEFAAERFAGTALRKRRQRLREKPYREVRRAQGRLAQANAGMAYQKFLSENPELEKKALAKWLQKRKLKRRYAAAAREAAKGMKHTTQVFSAAGGAVRALAQAAVSHKAALGVVGIGMLIISMFGSLFSSCCAMLSGVQSAVTATCYVADDAQINQSELRYTELETDLQIEIGRTQEDYPGYDEYRLQIGEIGHNPYELMGYLSAAYDDFTYAQVEAEINRLFGEQYRLTREEITEIRTYTDEEGEEQEYEWHVLKTTLSVQPLSDIIAGSLAPGDASDRYGVYMQTCGNRQCYGNPFDFAWISYVTSPYGYRLHPITGEKDLHRGVDIGIAEGTPIKAAQDGTVVSAGNAGGYGLCVVIEGEDGYQSKYAHCLSLSVSAGQEVKRGDVIAAVGSTGNSTGPHLHLEVSHGGEYLNPYYFVDNGALGYTQGRRGGFGRQGTPAREDPGEPMGEDESAALLSVAERYLGFPYVWGGSTPETSFDCSGYVSYVVNQSGAGNVGRQTAQGLYDLTGPVPREELSAGDLVFFTGTYSTAAPVSHVGIYVGDGRMIHAGERVCFADLTSGYWLSHYFGAGRLR